MRERQRLPDVSSHERRLLAREAARQRTRRQRRIALAGTGGVLVLVVGGYLLLSGGGSAPGREGAAGSTPATTTAPPPQLPRGGRVLLPAYRVVALYGAPNDAQLGELGIGTPDEAGQKLLRQARRYVTPGRPVMPAMELIATLATAAPGDDGRYRLRQTAATIDAYLAAARRIRAMLILDIQPGRASFLTEARAYRRWLLQPDVALAIDPEWSMAPGELPGKVIGHTDASVVNDVAKYLSSLVASRDLPQKPLIVHQFTTGEIRHRRQLHGAPGVPLVVNIDGFGTRDNKVSKYDLFASATGRWFNGFKLFYHEDSGLMSPGAVLNLLPQPDVVVYE